MLGCEGGEKRSGERCEEVLRKGVEKCFWM